MNPRTAAEPAFDAIIALGSNIGDKQANIARAVIELCRDGDIRVVRNAQNYRTPPWGKTDQDWFVNSCVAVATRLVPRALLERCLDVERRMGRARAEKWGPRVIDLDLLIYRDVVMDDPDLILPHPRIAERPFVLVPLAEIAPDLRIAGRAARELAAEADLRGVEALA